MSRNAKRGLEASAFLLALGVLALYATITHRAGAAAQAMPDVGTFRVGSALGEERAGFSGRSKVQVFASPGTAGWSTLEECLKSAAVEKEMDFFTGVLVDEKAESDVEGVLREREGFRVVVRSLGGAFLGGLPAEFKCQELVDLLRTIREASNSPPEPSPIYASLLRSTEVLDELIQNREGEKAVKLVTLLEEFEGLGSPAVQAARAKVGK